MNENEIHMNKSEVFESASNSSVNESEEDIYQVNDRFKKVEGYHAVPHPYIGNFKPPRHDLSFDGLDDYVFKSAISETVTSMHESKTSASKTSKESMEMSKTIKPNFINFVKSSENVNSVNKENTYRQAENLRKSQSSRVNKRNWNGMMTQKLGDGFEFKKKACFVCGSLNHLIKDCNFYENKMVGKSVLNKEGKATGQREVRPLRGLSIKEQHLNIDFKEKVNTAKVNNITTAGPKAVVSVVQGHRDNVVKSLACWIWRPKRNVIKHISKDSRSYTPKRFDYVDPQGRLNSDQGIFDSGCSRHMTGNKFYLSDYQDIDGGFVAFAGSPKGGKITRKGKIRTGKLDFEDVYFVKECKFNLFSVSQMCDKKKSVLFTETECLILFPDFKLLDESQVLLKVPRQNNIYSFNLKNVVLTGDGKAAQSLL
ncbi:hypothetical protein Tco_0523893 [Tanacetum coccineum]